MSVFKLRPHHALCISYFEGKGYSPEFIDNMHFVIQSLNQEGQVQLTTESDDICACCPNNELGHCTYADKVKSYDEAVLTACKLRADQRLMWQELKELADSRIIQPGIREDICGDCQWSGICRKQA